MHNRTKRFMAVFSSASFLNDFGSDMICPVWPLFVTSFLGANVAVLGLIDGIGDAVVSVSQAGSGYLSDRLRKRKVFIWTGYLVGSLSRVGYALSTIWQALFPFKILDIFGKIRGAPRDAIVADISTRENRGRNFGLLRTMDNLGAIQPVQRTFVSELSPIEYRASMLGAFQMTIGLCALPASFIASLLWVSFGKFVPFYFSLGLTILATVLILFVKEQK